MSKLNRNFYVCLTVCKKVRFLGVQTTSMPKIQIKNTSNEEIQFRLRIEYRRDIRNDDDYFPEKEWKKIKPGENWKVDFGGKIRGGKATLLYKIGNKENTFVFYIRGTNPTEQEVKEFITCISQDKI